MAIGSANFSADATGSYEAQNFITPQQGIRDESGETFLKVGASAVQQGYQLTAAFKAKEFRGEVDAAINQEIGKQVLATQEAQPSDTQEFRDAIERAKQVQAQGGAGARLRTTILAEKLTREKAGASPLFANVYRQVAQEVLGDYDATLQFMAVAEESAASQMKGEADTRKQLIKSVYTMQSRSKGLVPFTKVPESMTDQELQEYITEASIVNRNLTVEEMQRQTWQDKQTVLQTTAAQQTAASSAVSANIALQKAETEEDEVGYIDTVRRNVDSEISQVMAREVFIPYANGQIDTTTPEFRASALQRENALRTIFRERLNAIPATTAAGRAARDSAEAAFEERLRTSREIINGDLSELKAVSDRVKYLKDKGAVKVYEAAPGLAGINATFPGAGGIFAQDFLFSSGKEAGGTVDTLRKQYGSLFSAMLNDASVKSIRQGGDLTGIAEEPANVLRASSVKMSASNDPQIMKDISDTEAWKVNTMRALDGMEIRGSALSGEERGLLLNGVLTRNFISNYEALKTESPNDASRIADRYHEAVKYVAPSAYLTAQQKASGNFGTTSDGYFVTDLPDQRVKTLVNQMNTLVDGLVATKTEDRLAPKDDTAARLYFLERFFGIKKQQSEVVEQ